MKYRSDIDGLRAIAVQAVLLGAQSERWIQACESRGIRVSMDGKGRALDNVFIERLWRTLKYEQVYPNPADNGHQLEALLRAYFAWYNDGRPHSSLGDRTPREVHSGLRAA